MLAGRLAGRLRAARAAPALPALRALSGAPPASPPPRPGAGLDFDDVQAAFKTRSTTDLLRAAVVFRACSWPWLVSQSGALLKLSRRVLGDGLTGWGLRQTVFGHFCAGEDAASLAPAVAALGRSGVGSILDYSKEADDEGEEEEAEAAPAPVTSNKPNKATRKKLQARIYDYESEAMCDENARITRGSIDAAAESGSKFAAIKVTALGKPELLLHLTQLLRETTDMFLTFDEPDLTRRQVRYMERTLTYDTFKATLKRSGVQFADGEIRQLFESVDASGDGHVDLVEWINQLDPLTLAAKGRLESYRRVPQLSPQEIDLMQAMLERARGLAQHAQARGVRLMIDAEHTYFQPAIDHITLGLQREFNSAGEAVIFNTIQCYLRDSYDRAEVDLERAMREGWRYAVKAVRGAYLVLESKRALDMGYPNPIHGSLEDTHASYDKVVDYMLQNNAHADVLVATHNEASVKRAVQRMGELGIAPKGGGVTFGQLYGMCDHVSFGLGAAGYDVYKYVPYGEVFDVVPYLIRRAEENSGLLENSRDYALVKKELKRRKAPLAWVV